MEVLPPPSCFTVPTTTSTLFPECINVSQPRPIKPTSIPLLARSAPASPSNGPACSDSIISSTKLSPPISNVPASPICSTIPSSIELSQSFVDFAPSQNDRPILAQVKTNRDATPPGSNVSLHMLLATPIWISTPPTPPHKPINNHPSRDQQTVFTPILTSASFPAITPPHVEPTRPQCGLKRCLSSPAASPCLRITSDPSLNFDISRLPRETHTAHVEIHPKSLFSPPSEFSDSEYTSSLKDLSPAGSSNAHFSSDIRTEDLKDVVRILHALRELLATELDYVRDLRVLSVYIQRLSKFEVRASAFARASATFASGPWVTAYAGQTLTQMDPMIPSASPPSTKPVFTEAEADILSRNINDILLVHDEFLSTLQDILLPLGCSNATGLHQYESEDVSTLLSVLKNVSQTFIAEAPKFDVYQTFCAGHPEALNLIKRAMSQYASEWESFEQRCSVSISRSSYPGKSSPVSTSSPHQSSLAGEVIEQKRRRTTSLTSSGSRTTSRSAKEGYRAFDKSQSRLAFVDYLIKPVQRICKYPLLLEQLKPRTLVVGSSDVVFIIENAIQIMRSVATSVDEAHRRREAVTKSSLIISRFILPPVSPPLTSGPTAVPQLPVHALTSSFLSSLGPCLLAGSLDVLYYSPYNSIEDFSSLTAKYLGVFLYPGGYIILAKIYKGKKYEPRHWFSLADFEITGEERGEAMLPCSFRLSSKSIHFELAAACQRERNIWVQSVRDSVKQQRVWVNAPLPSYNTIGSSHQFVDVTDEFKPTTLGGSDGESSTIAARGESRRRKLTLKKNDAAALQEHFRLPNRRSSTTSIKSIFATLNYDSNSIYINRSMISGRLQVDHGLQDVASPVCLSARLYASLHDEELFPQPSQESREWSGFSRSNSAISVAGLARNRLSKQESLRIPRRKAPSYDNVVIYQSRTEENRPHGKAFHFPPLPDLIDSHSTEITRPLSTSSTYFSSTPCSSNSTPTDGSGSFSRPHSPLSLGRKNSRFSLRNVKDFLHINVSQSATLSPDRLHPENLDTGHSSPLRSRWKRGPVRRRSRSAPPDEDLVSS